MTAKEKILKASLELFIKKGFHATSTKMILEKSGTSNGGLYHHFKTKEDIAQEIFYNIKKELIENIYIHTKGTNKIREFMWRYWRATIEWALDEAQKKLFLDMFSKTPMIRNCTNIKKNIDYQFIIDMLQEAVLTKELLNQDIHYLIYNFAGITDGVIFYLNLNPSKNSETFLKEKFKLYWRSIVNI